VHVYGFLSISHYQRGFFAVTIFHAVQYLALVWLKDAERPWARRAALQSVRSARALGFPLFWGAIFAAGYVWENHVSALGRVVSPVLPAILLAAVSAHHYLVDSLIWRAPKARASRA
jgi:hypothetical protein